MNPVVHSLGHVIAVEIGAVAIGPYRSGVEERDGGRVLGSNALADGIELAGSVFALIWSHRWGWCDDHLGAAVDDELVQQDQRVVLLCGVELGIPY